MDGRPPETAATVSVAPFELPGVDSVRYVLEVGTPQDNAMATVIRREIVSDGPQGSFSYIAPCVAGPTEQELAQVTLEVLEVRDEDGPVDVLLPPPLTSTFTCRTNADTPVEFNVAVMRPARTGFTDLLVDIDEVFCSAKADCDPTLVPGDDGERGVGLVTGLACTANPQGTAELAQTLVYAADLRCAAPADVTSPTQHFAGSILVEDKDFHNTATGFTDAAFAGSGCALDAVGWLFSRPVGDATPDRLITPIPIITWSIRGFDNTPACHMDALVDATYADVGYVYGAYEDVGSPPATHLSLLLLGGQPPPDVAGGRVPLRLIHAWDSGRGAPEGFTHGSFVARRGGEAVPVRVAGAWLGTLEGDTLLCAQLADEDDAFYSVALRRDPVGRWFCVGGDSDFAVDPLSGPTGEGCALLPIDTAPCVFTP